MTVYYHKMEDNWVLNFWKTELDLECDDKEMDMEAIWQNHEVQEDGSWNLAAGLPKWYDCEGIDGGLRMDNFEDYEVLTMQYQTMVDSVNDDTEDGHLCFQEYPTVEGVQSMYLRDSNWPFTIFPWVDAKPLSYDELFPNQEPEWFVFKEEWMCPKNKET